MKESSIMPKELYEWYFLDVMKYRNLVAVEPYEWFCGTWCVMSILNFFLWTTFWTKDTLDMITMAKFKDYNGKDTIDESEILLYLSQLGFKTTWLGMTEDYLKKYIADPLWFLQWQWIDFQSNISFDDSVKATEKLLRHQNFSLWEQISSVKEIIEMYQKRNRVFIIWWDYYILRDDEDMRENNESAWHLVLCNWIDQHTWKLRIFDPGPYARNNELIETSRIEKAILYSWQPLSIMMIEYEPRATILDA